MTFPEDEQVCIILPISVKGELVKWYVYCYLIGAELQNLLLWHLPYIRMIKRMNTNTFWNNSKSYVLKIQFMM